MTSTTSPETSPPGLLLPTSTSYPLGTGTPRDAAIHSQQAMSNSQQRANAIGGRKGRRRRRHTRGGASVGSVNVPQFHMQYKPTGGPGSSPNDQITGLSSTSMQQAAWSKSDQAAMQQGGFKYLLPYKKSRSKRSRKSRSKRSQRSRSIIYG